MSKKVTIGTRVEEDYASSIAWFAKRENFSTADFVRSALSRRVTLSIQQKTAELDQLTQMVGLMRDALDNGTWKKLSREAPTVYPSAHETWTEQLTQKKDLIAMIQRDIDEMREKIQPMGVGII
jgi:hypothetical protein